jgi:predicted NAD/FAD-binding protein
VAVIGSGVAGLTAAHILQKQHDVTLFEADERPGGHAHTHDVVTPDAGTLRVDTGFIVHNRATYPNLVRLFGELGVATQPTSMSMSVRCEGCGLEYAGALGLRGVFAQRRSLARLRFLRMLTEVKTFHLKARRLLQEPDGDEQTLGDFLGAHGFSDYFVHHYMIPVVAAVWSAGTETALLYPARYLFQFLANHGLLSVKGSHQWYSVTGGSRTYVDAVTKGLSGLRLSTPVLSLRRDGDGVVIRTADGDVERFAHAVVATHPRTALGLLEAPKTDEADVLGAIGYSPNETVLHSDDSVLPRSLEARASWNYLLPGCDSSSERVLVSYDMNRLQSLPTRRPHVVTLNATERIDPSKVLARMSYEHPVYTPGSVAAQRRLPALNDRTVAFAGAYHGWGFHEDGCLSGVRAAAALGTAW